MGDPDPVGTVMGMDLTADEKEMILGGTAARMLSSQP
jgi:hypothetical protein